MDDLIELIGDMVLAHPLLAATPREFSVALVGSRAVGYHVPESDYDFMVVCDAETFGRVAARADQCPSSPAIDLCRNAEMTAERRRVKVDAALYTRERIEEALGAYRDVLRWIWTNAKAVVDSDHVIVKIRNDFRAYPREVLERKIKYHFLRDFDLSVHGLTYHPESKNLFSVVHAMSAKIAEFCKLCCLLDGKPYPYDKWLLRAAQDTSLGGTLAPIFARVLAIVTTLGGDLPGNADRIGAAVDALDTEACDMIEAALVSWGVDEAWVRNAYHYLDDLLFDGGPETKCV
jgi:predicted nucleotidyltransferase